MNFPIDKTKTICIIDDDNIHHFTIKKTIQLQGYNKEMLFFYNGFDAIDFFNQNLNNSEALPDVIFLDLNMPIVNGWQFLDQYALLKSQIKKTIKIYVVSSSIDQTEINRAISIAEVSGYLSKPLRPEIIREVFLTKNTN